MKRDAQPERATKQRTAKQLTTRDLVQVRGGADAKLDPHTGQKISVDW